MDAQLFYKGDILQMRDKSQWEILEVHFENLINEYLYEIKNIRTGQSDFEAEVELNRKAIVIRFSDKIDFKRSKGAKVYNLEDYRKKRA